MRHLVLIACENPVDAATAAAYFQTQKGCVRAWVDGLTARAEFEKDSSIVAFAPADSMVHVEPCVPAGFEPPTTGG
jgi:hypothetical protein